MQVEITEMPALRLATLRHTGPYHQISNTFRRLHTIAAEARLLGEGVLLVGLYHDDPRTTPADQLRSDACVTIGEGVPLPPGLTEYRLDSGKYAKTVHTGSYEQLRDVWARLLGESLPAGGHRMRPGPSMELYRNTPMQVPADQLITELYAPVA